MAAQSVGLVALLIGALRVAGVSAAPVGRLITLWLRYMKTTRGKIDQALGGAASIIKYELAAWVVEGMLRGAGAELHKAARMAEGRLESLGLELLAEMTGVRPKKSTRYHLKIWAGQVMSKKIEAQTGLYFPMYPPDKMARGMESFIVQAIVGNGLVDGVRVMSSEQAGQWAQFVATQYHARKGTIAHDEERLSNYEAVKRYRTTHKQVGLPINSDSIEIRNIVRVYKQRYDARVEQIRLEKEQAAENANQ